MKVNISFSTVLEDDIDNDADKAVRKLDNHLRKVLGKDFNVNVSLETRLGKSIHIGFYRARNPSPANNIAMNSKSFFTFLMYLSDNYGRSGDLEKITIEQAQGPRSVKYRKISSKKSVMDATDKFIRWFNKNSDAIKEL